MPGRTEGRRLFAGLDVSTQSCKLVVLDVDAGTILHVSRVEYDTDLPHFGTQGGTVPGLGVGVSESDPRMWIESVELAVTRAAEDSIPLSEIRCISVSGQQHGLVALTKNGELARARSKLWNDVSTADECSILTEAVGGPEAMIREVGNTQRPGYTAGKILHLRGNEPETYARSHTLFLVHNFINWYLTGGPEGGVAVMEPGDTSGMALWHPGTGRWSRNVMDAIDPGLSEKLPPVHPSDRSIGTVAPRLAERFGLSPRCRVGAGSGDNMYGAIGTGNFEPGILTVSLGTSGTAYTFLEDPFIDPLGEIAAFRDSTGNHLPLVCVSNLANGYDALLEEAGLSHQDFSDLVLRTLPGAGGRVILPWFQGERTPDLPDAAPLYFGFGVADLDPAYLCRALVEGHVMNLYEGVTRLPLDPSEVRVTGGLSKSPAWCQVIADVFQADTVPVRGEGAALGAAVHAAWVWLRETGDGNTLADVARPFIRFDDVGRRTPDPTAKAGYALLRRLFRALSRRVQGREAEDPFLLRTQLRDASVPPSEADDS
jgi:xylulokinase